MDWHGNVHDNVNVFGLGGIDLLRCSCCGRASSETCYCQYIHNMLLWACKHAIVTMSNLDIYIDLCILSASESTVTFSSVSSRCFLWRAQRQAYRVLLLCIHTQTDKSSRHVRPAQHNTSLSQTAGPQIPAGSCPEYQSTVLSCLQSDYTDKWENDSAY